MLNPVVLLVDDRRSYRVQLRRVLINECEARVYEAENALDALTLLDVERLADQVHVVAADLRMPGLDGSQLLEQIGERWPKIRRALVTAYTSGELVAEAEYLVLDKALSLKAIASYLCELSRVAAA